MGEEEKNFEVNENPFSFKRFLKKCDDPSLCVNDTSDEIVVGKQINETQVCDDGNEITGEIPFPDVQDSSIVKKKAKGKKVKNLTINQEITSGQDENPFSFKNFVKKDAAVKTSGRVLQIVDDEICEIVNNDNCNVDNSLEANNTNKKNSEEKLVLQSSGHELNSQEIFEDEIPRLQNENKKLKKELKEIKQSKDDESKKVASLLKKLKHIEQKENEETAALEKVVHMVEKNLELTTQRALKAEAVVTKLREENKVLKTNSVSKAMYDDLVTQHDKLLTNIKDQAASAAQHLNITAAKAEESLKQLCSGVDSFKLVSELLKSIDRFSTVHNDSQT